MFSGTYTALVTPFTKRGKLDEKALQLLVERQINGGADGIVPVGTTGESPTVGPEEHVGIIELCVAFARGRLLVIAGTGANSTAEAIHLTRAAEKAGADGSLQVAPYYNKPTQEGLFRHFQAIARATKLPIILYNIPSRCGVSIEVETVKRLAQTCKNVVGIKEAWGDCNRVSQLYCALGPDFCILSGDDSLTLPFMAVGARGVISVASNIVSCGVVDMVKHFEHRKREVARILHLQLYPLFRDLFLETNPIPVKAALAMMGLIEEEYRLPLVPMGKENREKLRKTLKSLKII